MSEQKTSPQLKRGIAQKLIIKDALESSDRMILIGPDPDGDVEVSLECTNAATVAVVLNREGQEALADFLMQALGRA